MNGLEIIELNKASFMDKVLRREPSENAFVEINNLLACVPILKLDKESIDKCLTKFDVLHENAHSRLLNLYSKVLQCFVSDLNITEQQNIELTHLQYIFSLQEKEVNTIKSSLLYPVYQRFIKRVVADGKLTRDEKMRLENLSLCLRISKKVARNLYKIEAHRYLNSVLKESISNGMLSEGEERELEKIADNLQVTLNFTENAAENLKRHRHLWQLYKGNLPKLKTTIYLDKDEVCSAIIKAEIFEVATVYEPVKYSGYGQLRGVSNRGFQAGRVRTNEATGKTMRKLDSGTLYFTNKRLLLNGTRTNHSFTLLSLISGTFYTNGFVIERFRGRDQFFKFNGDLEALKLIFDSVMTKSRT